MANDRVAQLAAETLLSPDDLKARVAQEAVETLVTPDNAKARVAQVAVETLVTPDPLVPVEGSFTANAVRRRVQTGSFTANAVIFKTLSPGFPANAVIKRTISGAGFTADAVRGLFTPTGSLTANAVLKRGQTASFTANAAIKKPGAGVFTADARIIGLPITGSFTANAVRKRTMTGSFTANAIRFRTISAGKTFTANAVLKRREFFANAVIKRTAQLGSFTANATYANIKTGSFTANAIRFKTVSSVVTVLFSDDFNRTVSEWNGWGNGWNISSGSGSQLGHAAVDGSYGLSQAHQWFNATNPGIPNVTDFDAYFDFQAEAIGTGQNWSLYIYLEWGSSWMDMYSMAMPTASPYNMGFEAGADANGGNEVVYSVTAGSWYSIHWQQTGGNISRLKVWPQGTPEPSSWSVSYTAVGTPVGPFLWEVDGGYNTPTRVDNLLLLAPGGAFLPLTVNAVIAQRGFTASAWILRVASSSFLARAVIKRNQTASFTANATITQGYFRAYASIKAVRTGSTTANAVIRRAFGGTFTADAHFAFSFAGSFTASALLRTAGNVGSFTVDYAWWNPATGGGSGPGGSPPLIGVPTRIFVNGAEITDHVMWKTAQFSAKVNAQSGECLFTVVDRAHNLTFEFGDEIQLYIGGILRWGGWVLQVNRKFPFPVMKAPSTEARLYTISGIDYNRFLDRRILHDSSDPGRTWNYPAGTADNTIFNNIWPYFDTAGFTKNIQHVADGVLDIPGVTAKTGGNVAQGGFSMRDVLMHLSWDTGAIYYVTPTKVVTYVDADEISNPYTLTDTPSSALHAGYHDVRMTEDSTEMVNDAMVWGAGKGSANVVFARRQSEPSKDDHGRWQAGNFTSGIYKQATANAVAQARIDGSPESLRGAKSPKRAVELLTWEPVFGVGDVVAFHNSQFDYDDVLPVRSMTITWPTPLYPVFAIQLSWEIDAVWSFFDPWLPVGYPGIGGPGVIPGGGQDPPGGCSDGSCGITDSFDRAATADSWGTSDAGITWFEVGNPHGFTDGTKAVAEASSSGGYYLYFNGLYPITTDLNNFAVQFEVQANHDLDPGEPNTGDGSEVIGYYLGNGLYVEVGKDDTFANAPYIHWSAGSPGFPSSGTAYHSVDYTQPFMLKCERAGGGNITVKIWQSSNAEPGSPNATVTGLRSNFVFNEFDIQVIQQNIVKAELVVTFENLNITGVNRCEGDQFDNFARSIPVNTSTGTGPWGMATPSGLPWFNSGPGGYTSKGVVNGYGIIEQAAATTTGGQTGMIMFDDYTPVGQYYRNTTFSVFTQFRIAQAFPFYHYTASYLFDQTVSPFGRTGFGIDKQISGGSASDVALFFNSGTGFSSITTPVTLNVGSDYYVRYERNDTSHRLKLWNVNDPEPSAWMLEASGITHGPADQFQILHQRGNKVFVGDPDPDWRVWYKFIDFGWEGRSCYLSCGVTDTFPGSSLSLVWDVSILDGAPTYAVAANALRTTSLAADDGDIRFSRGLNPTRELRLRYRFFEPDLSAMGRIFMTFGGALVRIFPFGSNNINLSYGVPNVNGSIPVLSVDDGWQLLRIVIQTTTVDLYLWSEAGSEPVSPTMQLTGITGLSAQQFQWRTDNFSAPSVVDFIVDLADLDIDGNETCDAGATPDPDSGGVPSGTSLTEDLTALGTASGAPPAYPIMSQWQATNSILAGSAVLRIDGNIQYGNWIVLDADAGTVRIDPTVLATSTVSLTYITNGALP